MTPAYAAFKCALLQRYPTCEICGLRQSTAVNHCLYHKHGGIFDSFENCQAVCELCHNVLGHARWNKVAHWHRRYFEGYDMGAFNGKVNKTRREYFER